ncbi:hypothetical protein C4573_04095 [Candidatus Woesearchaeota archaeon]|nr:MAG: hypothetical protein C4573_04095 [Candidatus Woesearchaeota archaeon]
MKYALFFCLFFSLSSFASAVSIAGGNQQVTVNDGTVRSFDYLIGGADNIESYANGNLPNLSKYVTLIDENQYGPARPIQVQLDFSEGFNEIPAGRYTVFVGAKEYRSSTGMIGGIAAIQTKIDILVLYPGKYLEWSIDAQSTNVNETANVSLIIHNLGRETINEVSGIIRVYNPDGMLMSTAATDKKSLLPDELHTISAGVSTQGYAPGMYQVNATAHYDEAQDSKTADLRIGQLRVYVVDYTKTFAIDTINKMDIMIESDWSGTIKDVYAVVKTPNKDVKTANIDLPKFQRGTLEAYWDTKGLGKADVNATIQLFYNGQHSEEQVILYINETGEGDVPPKKEVKLELTTTAIVYIIIIVLLIGNLTYFIIRYLKRQKKPENNEEKKPYEEKNEVQK